MKLYSKSFLLVLSLIVGFSTVARGAADSGALVKVNKMSINANRPIMCSALNNPGSLNRSKKLKVTEEVFVARGERACERTTSGKLPFLGASNIVCKNVDEKKCECSMTVLCGDISKVLPLGLLMPILPF